MKLSVVTVSFLLLALGISAAADDAGDRDKLIGSWTAADNAAAGANSATWTLSSKGDSLQITETEGGAKVTEFTCTTNGQTCEIKSAGKKATVSMWYNGPKLVELETKGEETIQRRFAILPEGGMQIEIVPIVPSGKTETIQLKRAQASGS